MGVAEWEITEVEAGCVGVVGGAKGAGVDVVGPVQPHDNHPPPYTSKVRP